MLSLALAWLCRPLMKNSSTMIIEMGRKLFLCQSGKNVKKLVSYYALKIQLVFIERLIKNSSEEMTSPIKYAIVP